MLRTLWCVKPGLLVHAEDPVRLGLTYMLRTLWYVKPELVVHAADPVVCEARASRTCCRPCGT
jgi:hypothetical protein